MVNKRNKMKVRQLLVLLLSLLMVMGLSVTFAPGVMAEDGGNEVKPVVTVNPKVDFNIMQAMDNPSEALQYISPFSEDNGKWTYKADVTFGLPSGYTGEKPVKLVFNCLIKML